MKVSENCYELIKSMEGLELSAYVDPGTGNLPITIGYGSTRKTDGTRFDIGDTITKDEAEDLLRHEVDKKALFVNTLLLTTKINQNQFDALVSFAYNVGLSALQSSTLLKKVKLNPSDPSIEFEFMRWNKSGGKTMKGLTERRMEEYKLYKTQT